jgi:uncharacterized protein YbjQ (UPF0145 family)
LLVKQAGFDPLGLVLGSSIYHVGFDRSGWKESAESSVLSQAMYQARELAMTRMVEEAGELGADGIVAVHLDIGRFESEDEAAEFIAIGTAVKHREGSFSAPLAAVPSRVVCRARTSGRFCRLAIDRWGW